MFFRFFAVGAFATFFTIGLLTLPHYGINWDEPVHYIRGQAFLRFFMTGEKDYTGMPRIRANYYNNLLVKIPKDVEYADDNIFRRSIYQYDGGPNYLSFLFFKKGDDRGHPPLNGIMASFFNYVFYQKLGVIGDIESYHLFIVLMSAALIGLVFFMVSEYGVFAGIVAALSLGLYPLFFSESHFNIKDPVSAAFVSFTLYTFYKGVVKNSLKWMLASSIFAGLALGTKFNIFFAGFILLPWLVIYLSKNSRFFALRGIAKIILGVVLLIIISFGILYASWPFLWEDPIKNILAIFTYYKEIGYTESYQPAHYLVFGGFNIYPIQAVLFTTPLVILFLSSIGVLYAFKNGLGEKYHTSLFVLFWFLVPIFRVVLPNAGIYGGLRQIMEYIPAMAVLAGIGAAYIVKLLNGYITILTNKIWKKQFNNVTIEQWNNRIRTILQLIVIVSFIPITLEIISLHPNQNVYFNPLIGGLKGAKEKNFPDWGVTLGSAYKAGITWMNKNAEPNARLALVKGLLQNIPANQIRKDIYFSEFYYSGYLKKGEYLMEVIDYRWALDIPEEKRMYIETLPVVYDVKVDGVPILNIWRNK